jgi:hypothetical protein
MAAVILPVWAAVLGSCGFLVFRVNVNRVNVRCMYTEVVISVRVNW